MGVPARLRPLDGEPEVWENGAFHTVRSQDCGLVQLRGSAQAWSLSRWTGDGWLRLNPENGRELVLPVGYYRLTVSVRLPNGDQLASRREFSLNARETKQIDLRQREYDWKAHLSSQTLPALPARTLDGQLLPDFFRQDGRPALVFWLEEGAEPTEHVLNELLEQRGALDALPVRVLFLVRGRGSLEQPTLAKVLACWSRPQVLLDDWAYDLEAIARHLGRDPDAAPLAVVCGGAGQAVYSVSGYQVGSVALMVRTAEYLCEAM